MAFLYTSKSFLSAISPSIGYIICEIHRTVDPALFLPEARRFQIKVYSCETFFLDDVALVKIVRGCIFSLVFLFDLLPDTDIFMEGNLIRGGWFCFIQKFSFNRRSVRG